MCGKLKSLKGEAAWFGNGTDLDRPNAADAQRQVAAGGPAWRPVDGSSPPVEVSEQAGQWRHG